MNKFLMLFMLSMFMGIGVSLYDIYLDSSVAQVQTIDLSNGEGRSCQKP